MKKPFDSLALLVLHSWDSAAAMKIAQNHSTSIAAILIFLYLQVSAIFYNEILIGMYLCISQLLHN